MEDNSILKAAALEAAQKAMKEYPATTEEPTEAAPVQEPSSMFEEDSAIDFGFYSDDLPKADEDVPIGNVAVATPDDAKATPVEADAPLSDSDLDADNTKLNDLNLDDLRSYVPTGQEEGFEVYSGELALELNDYAKELVTKYGMSVKDAVSARDARAQARIIEERAKYLREHANAGIIKIREGDEGALALTEEEHSKLTRVREIKLVEIQEEIIKTIPIIAVAPSNKRDLLDKVTGIFCEDKVPLPSSCDYASFRGMQIFELVQSYTRPDDTFEDALSRKAQVIYEAFQGSTRLKKYDNDRKVILTYDDFIRNYSYYDIDMSIFSIVCASSKEVTEGELRCPRCGRFTKVKYNVRKLLYSQDLPDHWKERFDNVLKYRADIDKLNSIQSRFWNGIRMQSNVSKNIYDIKIPMISKALNVGHFIGRQANGDDMEFFMTAMFVNKMHIYVPDKNSYIPIEEDEQGLLLDWFRKIPQDDVDAIRLLIRDEVLSMSFKGQVECAIDNKCHHKWDNDYLIEDLVFLRVRDTPDMTI